jgi:hypothetical protein
MAAQRGVSMAELVRQSVDQLLKENEQAERWRRALAVVGSFRGGPGDVSTNHDKYLDEAYAE